MHTVTPSHPAARLRRVASVLISSVLLVGCAPAGFIRLKRRGARTWLLGAYAVAGLPCFLAVYGYLGIIGFAAFLPELDMRVGDNVARTVRNEGGNYESTFLETRRDTHGHHELIRVQVEPHGGNLLHYHRSFEETFTVIEGELTVQIGERTVVLKPGESATVPRGTMHTFRNEADVMCTMTVRIEPARGLEKSIRAGYGLANDNTINSGGTMKVIWRYALILAYSETYLDGIPSIIQDPLVPALARIAQWKGEDAEMMKYFGFDRADERYAVTQRH
ncbi:MAG: cupin domain-containing protein [Opitutaceae bacterium]|nr:cupin domain-containing protein [Opitutaceae bacterium]